MHSISDLTTFCRKTTGDVPSKLVGASTTVVGSKMYLFGGRLVSERRMAADLYVFDLETFHWERIPISPEDEVPRARYFHSADTWNNQLIIFGGMSNKFDSPNPDDLCVLNDVRFFDLATRRWLPSSASNRGLPDMGSDSLVPRARYAHLSSVTADRLFIIGGQDFFNVWLDDVYIYDLLGKAWVQRRDYPRHCGTYRSVAVSGDLRVRLPQDELRSQTPSQLGPPGARFRADRTPPSTREFTSSESLVNLPYSTVPTEDYPSDIYLYSNYNFTDVKRELEVFSPLPDSDFTIHDRSLSMSGYSFPPGLRFPAGAILGTHFIVAGTYLAHTYQSFSIWALDLVTMTWSRIDPGSAVSTGSWFRGCLWAESNKFLIFGNRHGNLVDDYNRRLLSWDHVAIVDLEAFGIYQPPPLKLDIPMQQLGLSALEESVLTDFEIICDDGRKIPCSRKILEERWPWFKEQRKRFAQTATRALESLPASPTHVGLPELPGVVALDDARADPRLTPRAFQLSEPYPITLALLQYFYSLALITPLQHAPAVLSQLLVLSNTYQITHLESLVKHAMHRALSNSTSVGVYEVATLCSCRSLQIRALKTVMSYSQKRPSGRSRDRGDGNGGSRPPDANGGSKSTGGGPGESSTTSRPRGTSDAPFRSEQYGGNVGSSRGYTTNDVSPTDVNPKASTSAGLDRRPRPDSFVKRDRGFSVVSISTDSELFAVAELMSPSVARMSDIEEYPEDLFVRVDSPLGETTHRFRGSRDFDGPDRLSASSSLLDIPFYLPSSPSAQSAYFSEFEADQFSDDPYDRAYPPMPATSSYAAFHLPRPRPRFSYLSASDSDTPSLRSSASYSSLTSASRSPQRLNSPTTPMTPDFMSASAPHLSIIEERHPEDPEITHNVLPNLTGDIKAPALLSDPYVNQRLASPREEPLKVFQTTWAKKKIPKLVRPSEPSNLLDSPIPSREPSPLLSPLSPGPYSRTVSPVPSTPATVTRSPAGHTTFLSRFTSPPKKDKDSTKAKLGSGKYRNSQASSIDSRSSKAEEKRAKKARTEALALELKLRTQERADADNRSVHSSRSNNRDKLGLLDGRTAMYGGLMNI